MVTPSGGVSPPTFFTPTDTVSQWPWVKCLSQNNVKHRGGNYKLGLHQAFTVTSLTLSMHSFPSDLEKFYHSYYYVKEFIERLLLVQTKYLAFKDSFVVLCVQAQQNNFNINPDVAYCVNCEWANT